MNSVGGCNGGVGACCVVVDGTKDANKAPKTQQISLLSDEDEDIIDASAKIEFRTFKQLLSEMWIPSFSACKNLRIILSYISKILFSTDGIRKKTADDVWRMNEGIVMKVLLLDLLEYVGGQDSCTKPTSTVEDLRAYISEYRASRENNDDDDPFVSRIRFTDKTYLLWLNDYKAYSKRMIKRTTYSKKRLCVSPARTGSFREEQEQEEEEEDDEEEREIVEETTPTNVEDLLDTTIFAKGNRERQEDEEDRLPQYITKERNGMLLTWKTPGEKGTTLIRLDVYKVKDIANKDKRQWWKYAKIRSQFLADSTSSNQELQDMLNSAAKRMAKVPGLINDERRAMY